MNGHAVRRKQASERASKRAAPFSTTPFHHAIDGFKVHFAPVPPLNIKLGYVTFGLSFQIFDQQQPHPQIDVFDGGNPRVYSRCASAYSTLTQSRDRNNHTDTVWQFGRPRCSARRRCVWSDALATSGNGVPIFESNTAGWNQKVFGR